MIRTVKVICFLSVVFVFLSHAFSQDKKARDGEKLFHSYCSGCHGQNGIGQDPENPAGGWDDDGERLAPSLDSKGHVWHHSPEMLFGYIKKGSIDDTSPMPSFGAVLKDTEIESLVLYIESLWSEEIRNNHKARFGDHPHMY